jgi:hypothetical protein
MKLHYNEILDTLQKNVQYRERDVIALVYHEYQLPYLRKRVGDMLYYFHRTGKMKRIIVSTKNSFRFEYQKV